MNKKNKKNLILKGSIKLFAEFGYGCTSVDDISKKVNVAKGTIYNYFDSKEAILEAILKKHEEYFSANVNDLLEKYDVFEDFLFNCLNMVFDYFSINIDELRVINSIIYLDNKDSKDFYNMHHNILLCKNRGISKFVDNGQISEDDIDFLHIIFWGMVTELVFFGDRNNKRYSVIKLKKIIKNIIGAKK
ncbi:MAG: TetR/AcrR family transcriptional regulator [Candidatus Muirbacterium halophilum]|nr:TetR/AcrR family transcriptional regulator [Candidatus Muirbacterium halophilum]MCK9474863.1 TetR/AcrR family transcriptional regulator [Candidatus Muirbacterium halophilum]